jgi:hypothetical protein
MKFLLLGKCFRHFQFVKACYAPCSRECWVAGHSLRRDGLSPAGVGFSVGADMSYMGQNENKVLSGMVPRTTMRLSCV